MYMKILFLIFNVFGLSLLGFAEPAPFQTERERTCRIYTSATLLKGLLPLGEISTQEILVLNNHTISTLVFYTGKPIGYRTSNGETKLIESALKDREDNRLVATIYLNENGLAKRVQFSDNVKSSEAYNLDNLGAVFEYDGQIVMTNDGVHKIQLKASVWCM